MHGTLVSLFVFRQKRRSLFPTRLLVLQMEVVVEQYQIQSESMNKQVVRGIELEVAARKRGAPVEVEWCPSI